MKNTKIICKMRPKTQNEDTLREMIIAGMDVARFNFSHGTHEEQLTKFNLLKKVREELNIPVAAMLDTKGPEIRTGKLVGGEPVCLEPGSEYTLTTREVIGDASVGHVTYDGLPEDVSEGDKLLIDDGLPGVQRRHVGTAEGRECSRRSCAPARSYGAGSERYRVCNRA